ncbi:hypothetical protein N7G274_004436 [Stereocaulon virgatum]|uniref:Uncharacterized protein n=1 Tax=Stereocaulon virgatum TaxID=373712 RepID=A0ABR4ADQ2_9LECA
MPLAECVEANKVEVPESCVLPPLYSKSVEVRHGEKREPSADDVKHSCLRIAPSSWRQIERLELLTSSRMHAQNKANKVLYEQRECLETFQKMIVDDHRASS